MLVIFQVEEPSFWETEDSYLIESTEMRTNKGE